MANTGGYSAGSIFLQVVPSFQGFEREARRVAKGMEGIFEESLDNASKRGAEKARRHFDDVMGDDLKKSSRKGGQDAGDEFSGAFERILQKRLGKALDALGKSGGDQLNNIERRLSSLKNAKVGIDLDAGSMLAEIKAIDEEVDKATRNRTLSVDARINAKAMLAELREINREIKGVDGKKINVKVDYDDRGAVSKLNAFNRILGRSGSQAEDTANSFRTFNGVLLTSVTLGPALIPIIAALAGGLLALGPAAIAAGAGLGALAIGFSGIGTAIQALSAASDKSTKDTHNNAKKIANAADQVADAQLRLKRATRDAAQTRQDAAKRVVDAEQSAARGVESALSRQEDAEKSLQDAQKDSLKAQQDLIEARRDAQKDLDDIADRQKRNALDERQAVIDLFNATVEYNAVQADKGSTNLEREQSSINLENARLRLSDIRKEEKDLNAERKKGVNDSDKVKTAEERVADALDRQKEAQESVADAAKEVTRARLDGAAEVAKAVEAQRRAEVDASEQVADANKALIRSQEDYKDALFETSEVGSAAALNLANAMAALGPAGQKFARFIFGLRDEFYQVRNAVQAGLFPGLEKSISILVKTYLPSFTRFMGTLGKTLGNIAVLAAQTLTNKTWKQFFAVFESVSPKLIENYSKAFFNLATAVAQILTTVAPFAVEFSEGFKELTDQFLKFTQSKQGQKLLTDFLDSVKKLGPDVMRFFEALAPALFALMKALLPLGDIILRALTALLEWIAGMDPKILQGIVLAIITLIAAFQIAAGVISALATIMLPFGSVVGVVVIAVVALIGALVYLYTTSETARKIMNAVFKAIGEAVKWYWDNILLPYWKLLGKIISEVAKGVSYAWTTWIWPALKALGDFVSWLWNKILHPVFTTFGKVVSEVFHDISWLWSNVLWPVLKVIGKIVLELWELAFKVAFNAIGKGFELLGKGMKFVWDKAIFPVIKLLAKAMGIDIDNGTELKNGLVAAFKKSIELIGQAWDKLKELAKAPIKFVLDTVFNHGLIDGFNWLAGKLGMDKIDYIPIPKGFKTGGIDSSYGIRPGYTPGRDTHLIAVGGGEAILRPEATRALGSDWVHGVNKAARNGGVRGAGRFLGYFKNGGEVQGGSGVGIFDRTTYHGKAMDYYTVRMLQAAEAILGRTLSVSQGSYSTSVAASGSTHAGGGALDISVRALSGALRQAAVTAMRTAGFAAWLRSPSQGPWPWHIHAIAAGDPTASASAKRQVQSYYNGGDGLGGKDNGPDVKKDPSLLKRILGGAGDILGDLRDVISSPLNWIKSKVEGPLGELKKKFGDNFFTQQLSKVPDKFFGAIVDKIKAILPGGDDDISGGEWNGATSDLQKMVQGLAASKFGWKGGQWLALNWLVSHESSWNPNAKNPSSSAYGLFQFLDGTWGPYGDKTADPAKQALYGMQYIKDRYGDPAHARAFWQSNHWYSDGGVVPGGGDTVGASSLPDNGTMMYDNGGYLPPGLTTVVNLTGKPEPVFTAQQFEGMRGGTGGGIHYEPHFNASDLTADDVMDDFRFEVRRLGRGS